MYQYNGRYRAGPCRAKEVPLVWRIGVVASAAGLVVGSGALAALPARAAQGGQGNGPDSTSQRGQNPPGNNGTIKIEGIILEEGPNTPGHDNDPHVSCPFAIQWYGIDNGLQRVTVAFTAQPPSGQFQAVPVTSGPTSFSDFGSGAGGTFNFSRTYQLDTSGLHKQPQQGYHVKVVVTDTFSQGNDTKSKVFWLGLCTQPATSPSPTPSESVSPTPTPTVTVSPTVSPTGSISQPPQGNFSSPPVQEVSPTSPVPLAAKPPAAKPPVVKPPVSTQVLGKKITRQLPAGAPAGDGGLLDSSGHGPGPVGWGLMAAGLGLVVFFLPRKRYSGVHRR